MEKIDNEYAMKILDIEEDFHVNHLQIYLKLKFQVLVSINNIYQFHFYIVNNLIINLFETIRFSFVVLVEYQYLIENIAK